MSRFREYFLALSAAERASFALRVGTSVGYLLQVAYGRKQAGLGFADSLVSVAGGELSLDDLPLTERARQQHQIRMGA